jgi:hypothetical protein
MSGLEGDRRDGIVHYSTPTQCARDVPDLLFTAVYPSGSARLGRYTQTMDRKIPVVLPRLQESILSSRAINGVNSSAGLRHRISWDGLYAQCTTWEFVPTL